MRTAICLTMLGALSISAAAQVYDFNTPVDDDWQYPFNSLPGTRPVASCFGSLGTGVPSFNDFNDRDGIFVIAWDTSTQIDPNLGASAYNIQSVTITLTSESGATWDIDLTPDEWYTFDVDNDTLINGDGIPRGQPGDTDGESDDVDPGRPLELFGSGFGPVYTIDSWNENSAYVGGRNDAPAPRDPYPFVWDPNGHVLHVEESVQGGFNDAFGVFNFTPTPWAIGVPVGYEPNQATAPFPVVFDVDLSLYGGRVRGYFQNQLNHGRVVVSVTALVDTVEGGVVGAQPSFFTKEGLSLEPGAKAPKLTIVLGPASIPGDVNQDGCVNISDLGVVLTNFGLSSGATLAQGDVTGDGRVDISDLGVVLANFGQGSC